ncbi:hypothetical protein AB0M02_45080 [Actinoplanes sp. NPDC051861]|uniref:hypothetical protein n=1 Tax=Actinoplanes sp. NPDC051861 TaxID=3155170 RepID=UPI0034296AAD
MKTAFPFLAAIAMLLANPLLIKRAKFQVGSWIARAGSGSAVPDRSVPDYLAPQQVLVYVEYAADIAQIVPSIALIGVGVIAGMPSDTSPSTAAAITLAVVLALVLVDTMLLAVSPQQYLRRKVLGLSAVPFVGVVANLIAMATMLSIS